MSFHRDYEVPAAPVRAWLVEEVAPRYGSITKLCEILGARTYVKATTWHRWIMRLAHKETVSVWPVDTLCLYLGEHISRFDPIYTSMD